MNSESVAILQAMLRIALYRSIYQTSPAGLAWIEMSNKFNFFSLFIEFQVVETGRPKRQKAKTKKQKVGKANHKLQSQNYRFDSDQNAKSVEVGHEF